MAVQLVLLVLLLAVVSIAIGLVITGPVLVIVDSSTLDKKTEASHWRRVAGSYLYFGCLAVALWSLRHSPTATEMMPMAEWRTSTLFLYVFKWCFAVVFLFSVAVTTTHAYQKHKLSWPVVIAACAPIVLYAGVRHGDTLPLRSAAQATAAAWYGLSNRAGGTSGQNVTAAVTRNTTVGSIFNLIQSISGHSLFSADNFSYTVLESVAANIAMAGGATVLAFSALVFLACTFATEWRYFSVLYCCILLLMLCAKNEELCPDWLTHALKWLHVWTLVSWAWRLLELALLLFLPLAWLIFSSNEGENRKTTQSVLIALSPCFVFVCGGFQRALMSE